MASYNYNGISLEHFVSDFACQNSQNIGVFEDTHAWTYQIISYKVVGGIKTSYKILNNMFHFFSSLLISPKYSVYFKFTPHFKFTVIIKL